MSTSITLLLVIVAVSAGVLLLTWLCKRQCKKLNENIIARSIGYPTSTIQGRTFHNSTPYLAFIEPPPIGFGHPVDMPQTAVSEPLGFNTTGHEDTYPSSRRAPYPAETSSYPPTNAAPYPLHSDNRRAPYPTEASCDPSTNTAQYPPHSDNKRAPYPAETSCYSPSNTAPYPPHSQNRTAPYPAETSYPPDNTVPYPVSSSMPQPSASNIKMNIHELSNSARIAPSAPTRSREASYPPSDEFRISHRSSSRIQNLPERFTGQITHARRTTPYPPTQSALCSEEPPPPSYEEAVNSKFE